MYFHGRCNVYVLFVLSMDIKERIGINVRRARLAARLSQEQLVAELETVSGERSLDQGYISRLESGKHNPSVVLLWRIAQALGVRISELVDERDDVTGGPTRD